MLRRGSSPRAWGTLLQHVLPRFLMRFIPTRVGNTALSMLLFCRPTVHPHARGEHTPIVWHLASNLGSSPRAWGTLLI